MSCQAVCQGAVEQGLGQPLAPPLIAWPSHPPPALPRTRVATSMAPTSSFSCVFNNRKPPERAGRVEE